MYRTKLNIKVGFQVIAFLFITTFTVYSQNTTGMLLGGVRDSNGHLIIGAKVTAIHEDTQAIRSCKTNRAGEYALGLLPIGKYTLTFEAISFKAFAIKGITLEINQSVRMDAILQVGDIRESITLEATQYYAKTESAEIGDVIQNKRILELPLNGRQFLQLAQLTPGVVENARGSSAQQLSGITGPRITVMGARESDNYFYLDGVSFTDRYYNTLSAPLSVDAIQEFKVQSKLYSAESGILAGGQINIVVKSGTNNHHGSVYGFFRNDFFDARNFFDTSNKPEFKHSQFGSTLGGPIVKNKVFYLGNYEGLRLSKALTKPFTVPTDKMRLGIFPNQIKDPKTGFPFLNNTIPDDRISQVAKAYLDYIPRANLGGSSNNYVASPSEINDNNQFTIKTDFKRNDNNSTFVRYTFYDANAYQPYGVVAHSSSVASLPGFGVFIKQRSQNLALTHTYVFNSSIVGEFRLGFNRTAGGQLQENYKTDFAGQNSIAGSSKKTIDWGLPRITGVTINGFGDVSTPISRRNNDIQSGYNMSLFYGKHNINFGGYYKRIQFNPYIPSLRRGMFVFDGSFTSVSGNPSQPFADFLLGIPAQGRWGAGDPTVYLRGNEWALYFQEDLKLLQKLTLNMGLRYEYLSPLSEKYNKWATLDIDNRRIVVASENGKTYPHELWVQGVEQSILPVTIVTSEQAGLDRSLKYKDRNNIAPRFGFALDFFGNNKTILRGGYGIFYNFATFNSIALQSLALPFYSGITAYNSAKNPKTFSNILGGALVSNRFDPYDIKFLTPYYQQWSFGIQQFLTRDFFIEAQYLGSRGVKLYSQKFYFAPPSPSSTPLPAQRAPIPGLGLFGLQSNAGDSNYHAGVLRVEKRLSRGLMAMGSYTYSKSIDNDSLGTSVASSNLDQGIYKHLERGLSSFDVRHRVIVSFTYDLLFKSENKMLKGLFGNWQVGGIITQQSGQPFSVNIIGDRANSGTQSQRPDLIKNPNLPSDQRTPERWFDTSAFVMQPVGSYGSAGRHILEGPGTNLVDLSLLKNIPLSDRHKLQFRTEFFNLFNHTNFDFPNRICAPAGNSCTLPGFGSIGAARDPRIIQFGLKYTF